MRLPPLSRECQKSGTEKEQRFWISPSKTKASSNEEKKLRGFFSEKCADLVDRVSFDRRLSDENWAPHPRSDLVSL
jgi:hypothetical protein